MAFSVVSALQSCSFQTPPVYYARSSHVLLSQPSISYIIKLLPKLNGDRSHVFQVSVKLGETEELTALRHFCFVHIRLNPGQLRSLDEVRSSVTVRLPDEAHKRCRGVPLNTRDCACQ